MEVTVAKPIAVRAAIRWRTAQIPRVPQNGSGIDDLRRLAPRGNDLAHTELGIVAYRLAVHAFAGLEMAKDTEIPRLSA